MSILIDARRDLARQQIESISAQRTIIAKRLQELYDAASALATLNGPHQVLDIIDTKNAKVVERNAIRFWLRAQGGGNLPISDAALHDAFTRTPELNRLISAANGAASISSDPHRYYRNGKFAPLPVTDEEAEEIYKRSEIRAPDKETAEEYRMVETFVRIANRARDESEMLMTIGHINTQDRAYAPFVLFEDGKFKVDAFKFGVTSSEYRAFDES